MTSAKQSRHDWNARYLAAAARWLRSRLLHLAKVRESLHTGYAATPGIPAAVPDDVAQAENELCAIAEEMQTHQTGTPALLYLKGRFGLTRFEYEILLMTLASELLADFDHLCADAQGDSSLHYPTLRLAMWLTKLETGHNESSEWSVLSEDGALRRDLLIEVKQPSGTALIHAALRADERILKYAQGSSRLDGRIAAFGTVRTPPADTALSVTQNAMVKALTGRFGKPASAWKTEWPIVHLLGSDGESKRTIAEQTARSLQLPSFFRLGIEQLPTAAAEIDLVARLWNREAKLFSIALYLDADDDVGLGGLAAAEGATSDRAALRSAALVRLTDQLNCPTFLSSRDAGPRLQKQRWPIEVPGLSPGEQTRIWTTVLKFDDEHAGRLAAQFSLGESTIRAIANEIGHPAAHPALSMRDRFTRVWDECRVRTRPRIDGLAQRIVTNATDEDLVLSETAGNLLEELGGQVRNRWRVYDQWQMRARLSRGLAISALFVGESGTGKTTAAEVLANRLRLDLFRIDLSAIVNKYIGETEKNLRRVFDAFENSGAVLFFDECDALFGKRTEVKDSHDRYANIEVSYLLQRLESYRGVAILATNNRGALDPAFLRRLRFVITFPLPDFAQRKKIWLRLLPPPSDPAREPPTCGLDYDWLAKFDKLTGGNIQSAAIHAAFLAAQRRHDAIRMPDVRDAVRTEYAKLNQPLRGADLELPVVLAVPPANVSGAKALESKVHA